VCFGLRFLQFYPLTAELAQDAIEQRLDQEHLSSSASTTQHSWTGATANQPDSPAESLLALLASELPKIIASSKQNVGKSQVSIPTPGKRRRLNSTTIDETYGSTTGDWSLPPPAELEYYIDTYFTHVHPWIPMLNQDRFRQRVADPKELAKIKVIIHAIIITISRYIPEELGLDAVWPVEKIREWTIMRSMESNTLEGLQALIMIAFNDVRKNFQILFLTLTARRLDTDMLTVPGPLSRR
jgi:hypothetical protein